MGLIGDIEHDVRSRERARDYIWRVRDAYLKDNRENLRRLLSDNESRGNILKIYPISRNIIEKLYKNVLGMDRKVAGSFKPRY